MKRFKTSIQIVNTEDSRMRNNRRLDKLNTKLHELLESDSSCCSGPDFPPPKRRVLHSPTWNPSDDEQAQPKIVEPPIHIMKTHLKANQQEQKRQKKTVPGNAERDKRIDFSRNKILKAGDRIAYCPNLNGMLLEVVVRIQSIRKLPSKESYSVKLENGETLQNPDTPLKKVFDYDFNEGYPSELFTCLGTYMCISGSQGRLYANEIQNKVNKDTSNMKAVYQNEFASLMSSIQSSVNLNRSQSDSSSSDESKTQGESHVSPHDFEYIAEEEDLTNPVEEPRMMVDSESKKDLEYVPDKADFQTAGQNLRARRPPFSGQVTTALDLICQAEIPTVLKENETFPISLIKSRSKVPVEIVADLGANLTSRILDVPSQARSKITSRNMVVDTSPQIHQTFNSTSPIVDTPNESTTEIAERKPRDQLVTQVTINIDQSPEFHTLQSESDEISCIAAPTFNKTVELIEDSESRTIQNKEMLDRDVLSSSKPQTSQFDASRISLCLRSLGIMDLGLELKYLFRYHESSLRKW